MLNNKLFEESELKYIPGIQINKDEQELINKLIKFKESDDPIFNIISSNTQTQTHNLINYNEPAEIFNLFPCNQPIFKTHDLIKWHILNFEIITENKKQYYKFEDDGGLYSFNNNISYIKLKKTLFLYFKRLLYLLNDSIDEDIINYLVINFFNNLNKCKYYKCLAWFLALFIFWFYSIRDTNLYFNEINLKDFRKWWRNEKKQEITQIKEILIKFNNICHLTFKDYEDLKIMVNFVIPKIADGWTKL
jgi:hypothetical protein